MRRVLTGIVAIWSFMVPLVVMAGGEEESHGHYELTWGSHFEVCGAFLKNLNSFPDLTHPMICEQPINPAFEEFRTPKWEQIDTIERIHLVEQVVDLEVNRMPYKNDKKGSAELRENYLEAARTGRITLYIARFNLDNYGANELVLRLEKKPGRIGHMGGGCVPGDDHFFRQGGGQNLYVLTSLESIDQTRSLNLKSMAHTGVFLFQGRTLLTEWSRSTKTGQYEPGKGGGAILVHDPVISHPPRFLPNNKICEFTFYE